MHVVGRRGKQTTRICTSGPAVSVGKTRHALKPYYCKLLHYAEHKIIGVRGASIARTVPVHDVYSICKIICLAGLQEKREPALCSRGKSVVLRGGDRETTRRGGGGTRE